jgi:hypothetical protein
MLITFWIAHLEPTDPTPAVSNNDIDNSHQVEIPKQIWTFWSNDSPPSLILACIEGWKRLHPEHKVTLLTPKTVNLYLKSIPPFDVSEVMPAHWSDWIRVAVIMERGGYWMDASTILGRPLQEILIPPSSKAHENVWVFSVNSTARKVPLIDNWFMAAPPHSLLITSWFLELSLAMRTIKTYLSDIKTLYGNQLFDSLVEGIDKNDEKGVDYFRANVALQKVIQIHGVPLPHVLKAEEGPMKLYNQAQWNGVVYAQKLVAEEESVDPGMWKLTHHARDEVERLVAHNHIHPHSIYSKFLKPMETKKK